MKVSQITFANEGIDQYRSRLKWPQLKYFRNKRQITRWPTQLLWTVRTFATCDKFNSQFSILKCRCRQNHFAHDPLTMKMTIKSMTMTLTFTSMTMTLTKLDYIFTTMITPMIRRGDSKRNREKQRRRSSRAACWWGSYASYWRLKIWCNLMIFKGCLLVVCILLSIIFFHPTRSSVGVRIFHIHFVKSQTK